MVIVCLSGDDGDGSDGCLIYIHAQSTTTHPAGAWESFDWSILKYKS